MKLHDILNQSHQLKFETSELTDEVLDKVSTDKDILEKMEKASNSVVSDEEITNSIEKILNDDGVSIQKPTIQLVLNALSKSDYSKNFVSECMPDLVDACVSNYIKVKRELLYDGFLIDEPGIGSQRLKYRRVSGFNTKGPKDSIPAITIRSVIDRDFNLEALKKVVSSDDPKYKKRLKVKNLGENDKKYVYDKLEQRGD